MERSEEPGKGIELYDQYKDGHDNPHEHKERPIG